MSVLSSPCTSLRSAYLVPSNVPATGDTAVAKPEPPPSRSSVGVERETLCIQDRALGSSPGCSTGCHRETLPRPGIQGRVPRQKDVTLRPAGWEGVIWVRRGGRASQQREQQEREWSFQGTEIEPAQKIQEGQAVRGEAGLSPRSQRTQVVLRIWNLLMSVVERH